MEHTTKRKILFLITKSNWGGAQRYVFDLATNLNPAQFDVVVALGGDGVLYTKLRDVGIRTIQIPGLTRDISVHQELKATRALYHIIKTERPDILHVNSSKAGFIGTLLGRLLRIPRIIFTAHGWAFNEQRPHWQKMMFKSVHYLTVLASHQTIAVSSAIKSQMNWPRAAKKITLIHLGRTMQELKSHDEARSILETKVINNEVGLSEYNTDIWIGTIAELHPIKGLPIALEAISILIHAFPRVRYVIIGDGQDLAMLQHRVRQLGLGKNVFFTGAITDAGRLLPAFDLFLLTSYSESFGYVLLEAGQAHLPVVASNVGGIPDIITDQTTGLLFPAGNAEACAFALSTLLSHQSQRHEMAAAHYANTQHFSLHNMLQKTIAVYTKTTLL